MNFELARSNMIEQQIRTWEVLDQRVLDLLGSVPREDFVPPRYRGLAFSDTGIPLGFGEVMMAPKVEARMLQVLAVEPGDRILEIGTGSGYDGASGDPGKSRAPRRARSSRGSCSCSTRTRCMVGLCTTRWSSARRGASTTPGW
jgi:hypothetical protein